MSLPPPGDRADELAAAYATLTARIEAACRDAGRPASDVTVVAITKTYPAADVRRLCTLGIRNIGENRDQEGAAKAEECADLDVTWHFVGQLQTNKARSVASYADVVHSVDRTALVDALAIGADRAERRLECLVQVSLDDEPGRGGAAPAEVGALADAVARHPALTLRGVMAVAPLGVDPAPAFERLAGIAAWLRTVHPTATWVSAGMSEDLEAAIRAGATHVRVGSALLGGRPPLR